MRELQIENNSFVMIWDSLVELANDTKKFTETVGINIGCNHGLINPHWTGRIFPNGFDSAIQFCKESYQEGVNDIQDCISKLSGIDLGTPRSAKRRRNYSMFDGDEIITERLYGGVPEFWETRYPKPVRGNPIVQVILPLGGLGIYSSKQLMWKCAVSTAMSCILEDSGWRTEIWGMNLAYRTYRGGDATDSAIAINIKKPQDPLNLDVMACIGSSWFYRTIAFQCKSAPLERNKNIKIKVGMGQTCNIIPGWFLEKISGQYPILIIPHVYSLTQSIEAGMQALKDFIGQTKHQGICK